MMSYKLFLFTLDEAIILKRHGPMMKMKKIPMLSKSRFLAGLQCRLRLWYQCYNRELASEVSPAQQAVFDMGHEVGQLATRLYPDGILIEDDHLHHEDAVQSTSMAMDNPKVKAVYEAGFIYDGVRIRVDILERLTEGKWNLIEVKSATSAKDIYLPDVAVQCRVLKGAGLEVDRVILMHLNNRYVYDGEKIELHKLFSRTDMTKKALIYQNQLPALLTDFKEMLAKPEEPQIKPGRQCSNPYACEFWEHCTHEMPENWVMDLTGISQKKLDELEAMGIRDIKDVPVSFSLTALQDRIKRCVITDQEYISRDLGGDLRDVAYPVHFLDFETLSAAIPRYAGTRPYQTIPFQWSDHILSKDGTMEHCEYLCEEDKDPRKEFTQSLLSALGRKGSIVTYTNYEAGIIKRLGMELPEYRNQLHTLLGRIKDLHRTIGKKYYHPAFHGSFSLKSVLPAILPAMGYEKLEIQEGQLAALRYLKMIDPSILRDEKEKIKIDLLTYCGHDTLAMLRIREELLRLS
jgi:predicted RecB family nuclease